MADDWAADGEVSEVAMESEAPAAVIAEIPEIKLFGKWSCEDVQVAITFNHVVRLYKDLVCQVPDMSLQDYIAVKEKYAKYLPHSAGR